MSKIDEKQEDKAIKMLVLAVKVAKPELTDEQAKNVIVNVGMMIQLRRLKNV